jgi:lysophospholipase L1-like esterase
LVVFFGANDSSVPEAENRQHVPLDEYLSNLEAIISHPSVTAHNPKIVLIAPAPIDEHLVWANDAAQGRTVISRKNAVLKEYSEAVVALGGRLGVPVVDLWKAFMAKTGWTEENWKQGEPLVGSLDVEQNQELVRLMHDGLHFNAAGYQVLFGEFLKVVRENITELAPENLPLLLPVWNDAKAWEEWDVAHK